ncbi:hypothetical protein L9F63_023276, partial [Diploptera punctata]
VNDIALSFVVFKSHGNMHSNTRYFCHIRHSEFILTFCALVLLPFLSSGYNDW